MHISLPGNLGYLIRTKKGCMADQSRHLQVYFPPSNKFPRLPIVHNMQYRKRYQQNKPNLCFASIILHQKKNEGGDT